MIGLFKSKYHIAIYDKNSNSAAKIATALKVYFHNKVVVEFYNDSRRMFMDLNIAKAKNHPFDATIIGPDEGPEAGMILKRSNPYMEVIRYENDFKLEQNASRIKYHHT